MLVGLLSVCTTAPSSSEDSSFTAGNSPQVSAGIPDGAPRIAKSSDGVPLQYRMYGHGEPAVVLVHGWSTDASYWSEQIGEVSAKYSLVTLDLAGHGGSGRNRKNWSIAQYAEDVATIVRQIPHQKVVLVGHAMMGGEIVLEAARRLGKRVIGIIGVDALKSVSQLPMSSQEIDAYVAPFRADYGGYTRNIVTERMFMSNADASLVRRIADDITSAPPEVAIPSIKAIAQFDIKAAFREARVPIFVISASFTGATEEERIGQLTPHFRAVIWNDVGHFLMIERPHRFNTLLKREIASMVERSL